MWNYFLSPEKSIVERDKDQWGAALILGVAIACLVASWGTFVWASNRGFDFRDEAYYLLWAAAPFTYKTSTSDFAYIWHPLYLAAGENIALYRIAGALFLDLCAALFGIAITRFVSAELNGRSTLISVVVAAATAAFWQFPQWEPSPNYNELNLAALLLFAGGLLLADTEHAESLASKKLITASLLPAVLAGVGFGLLSLNKPTSAVAALGLAIAWIFFVRTRRPVLCTIVATAASCTVVTALVLAIDGSFVVFAHRKLATITLLFANTDNKDVHGIWDSLIGPFLPERRWKIWSATEFGAVIFFICLASLSLALLPVRLFLRVRIGLYFALASALGIIVMVWRTKDLGGATVIPAFHAWHFTLLLLLLALAVIVFARGLIDVSESYTRSRIIAAILISLAPLVYSIGTANPLVMHMTSASIFWVGAAILLASQIPSDLKTETFQLLSGIVGIVTIGLLLGVMAAPGLIGHPIWEQEVRIELGPGHSFLLVDRPTADYIAKARSAAYSNGFKDQTPVIDISDIGPGIIYAINGRASGAPWLTDSEMTGNAADGIAYANAVLSTISRTELSRSWVITSPGTNANTSKSWLQRVHISFPSGYAFAGVARRVDFGWSQLIWRPLNDGIGYEARKPQIK